MISYRSEPIELEPFIYSKRIVKANEKFSTLSNNY